MGDAYTYIRILEAEGISKISEDATINSDYILSQLKDDYDLPYDRLCIHEVVFSLKNLKSDYGISALDVSKRLIDYNIHPPTIYFPQIVEEALMVEPTETESKETLDNFIDVMRIIISEAKGSPDILHNTPNTRLDEAKVARVPELRWRDH